MNTQANYQSPPLPVRRDSTRPAVSLDRRMGRARCRRPRRAGRPVPHNCRGTVSSVRVADCPRDLRPVSVLLMVPMHWAIADAVVRLADRRLPLGREA